MRARFFSWMAVSVVLATVATVLLMTSGAAAQDDVTTAAGADVATYAYLAAGLTTAISCIAAAFAVARVGAAAVGAVTEKPELFGRMLALVGLAEGIAIYGLIVSILILNQLG